MKQQRVSSTAGHMSMILLDIDDTLIDHSKAVALASLQFGRQFRERIPDYNENKFSERWKKEADKHVQAFLNGDITFQEQRRRRIRGIFSCDSFSDNKADEIFEHYLRQYEDSWELFPDVIPFLERNKDRGFAVLSDGAQHQQELKLQKTKIQHYFKFVITAESTGICKPNPSFFVKACELAATNPSDTIYIGDSLRKDAIGAYHAGLNGVWLNRKKEQADLEIYTIHDLREFVPDKALEWTRTYRATESYR